MLGRDGLTGLVVFAASLILFAFTLDLKESPLVPIGPGFYPRIVLGLTAVLALALVVSDVRGRKGGRATAKVPATANYRLVSALFAAFGLYVLALPYVGFRITTFVFVVLAQTLLDRPHDRRRWVIVLVIALVTTVVTYFVFERYLAVLLPRGRWTDF